MGGVGGVTVGVGIGVGVAITGLIAVGGRWEITRLHANGAVVCQGLTAWS